ncbi:MAG: hypothetical protein M3132_12040 [Actinomycetia bacterium]|nr:hypothetical protein [Actinomycetes bacterium]
MIPSPECATWAIGEVDAATTAVSTRRAFELSLRAAAMCQSPTPYTIGDVNPYEVSVVPVDAIPPGDGFWWSIVPDVAVTSEWLTFYDSRRPFEADLSNAISSYAVSRFDPEVRHEAWREFQARFAAAIAARVLLVDTLRDTSQDRDQVWFDTLANLMRDAQSRCRDVSDSSDEFFPDR